MCHKLTVGQIAVMDQRRADAHQRVTEIMASVEAHREAHGDECRPEACCCTIGQEATDALIHMPGHMMLPVVAAMAQQYADLRQGVAR